MAEQETIQVEKDGLPETERIVISEASSADAAAVCDFIYEQSGQRPSLDYIKHLLGSYPAYHVMLEEKIIALVYSRGHSSDLLEVVALYVASPYREKRIGSRLMERIEQNGSSWKNLFLSEPGVGQDPAVSFYKDRGWDVVFDTGSTRLMTKDIG